MWPTKQLVWPQILYSKSFYNIWNCYRISIRSITCQWLGYSIPLSSSIIDNNLNCQTIDVDNRPPIITNRNTINEPKFWDRVGEERSNQLLGASLVTSDDGTIATCAPHYINFGPRVNKREPTGDCWVSKDAGTRFTRVTPCLDRFTRFYFRTYINESSDNGWVSCQKQCKREDNSCMTGPYTFMCEWIVEWFGVKVVML